MDEQSKSIDPLLLKLPGLGPERIKKLAKSNIHCVEDLLFHLPIRYENRGEVTTIRELNHENYASITAKIDSCQVVYGRRRSLLVTASDQTGQINLRFFYFSASQVHQFKKNMWVSCYGKVYMQNMAPFMTHPEYQLSTSPPPEKPDSQKQLTAIYSALSNIPQRAISKIITAAIQQHILKIDELLPLELLKKLSLMPIQASLKILHSPSTNEDCQLLNDGMHPALQRLAIEEILAHSLASRLAAKKRVQKHGMIMSKFSRSWEELKSQLPFQLTSAQKKSVTEILTDMNDKTPMSRLLQGDVGSGKTVIAAAAALHAIDNNVQVALMAPTELLAEQHYQTIKQWFSILSIDCLLIRGKMSTSQRKETISAIHNGSIKMVIGTHAIFQSTVFFQNLGLIIIDEQHRFGVSQRFALLERSVKQNYLPHQLIMTATPIPRSLAMTFYNSLKISVLDELPKGRKPIVTAAMSNSKRDEIIKRIKIHCENKGQAYWVCPFINESEEQSVQAASTIAKLLQETLTSQSIALLHGQLPQKEKTETMQKFREGEISILVATTVIEVGVDVPNANLMIIENSERLGLSQLHQLRGRVGRGTKDSVCILLYQSPLSYYAKARINIMRTTNDGFKIAEEDLKIRGCGDLLGTRQTGGQIFKIADFPRDYELLPMVAKIADSCSDPENYFALIKRWVPQQDKYAYV